MIFMLMMQNGAFADKTVVTATNSKGKHIKDALVVVYDSGKNSVVCQATTDANGTAEVEVNVKAKYDLVAFHKDYSFLVKRKMRLAKPAKAILRSLSSGRAIAVISGEGISLFDGKEKDIQVGTTYGGHTSGDFRCMNDDTLIGFDKPKLTTIQRCHPGQEFKVKKGKKTARCELLWILPTGFVVEYRVSP